MPSVTAALALIQVKIQIELCDTIKQPIYQIVFCISWIWLSQVTCDCKLHQRTERALNEGVSY